MVLRDGAWENLAVPEPSAGAKRRQSFSFSAALPAVRAV